MARHLLFFGKFFSFPVPFLFFLCSPDIIRKQAAADAFKKISIAPRTSSKSYVKDLLLAAFEPRDDFLGRNDEPERPCEIVGCTQRKDTQRNAAIDKAESDLSNRPVPAGGKHKVSRLLERFFEAGFFRRLISGVMPGFS